MSTDYNFQEFPFEFSFSNDFCVPHLFWNAYFWATKQENKRFCVSGIHCAWFESAFWFLQVLLSSTGSFLSKDSQAFSTYLLQNVWKHLMFWPATTYFNQRLNELFSLGLEAWACLRCQIHFIFVEAKKLSLSKSKMIFFFENQDSSHRLKFCLSNAQNILISGIKFMYGMC